MQIEVVIAKLHRVTVTDANINYMGSVTIDEALLDASGILVGQKVQIVDLNNGERFDTYVIKGERDSGCFCLNGAAARKVVVGDICIVIAYGSMDYDEARTFKPHILFPKEGNRL